MPEKNYFFVFIKFIDARKQYTLIVVHVSSITPTIKEYYENAVRFLRILVSQPKFLDTNQVIEMVFKISLRTIFLPGRRWTIARPRSNVLQLGPRPSCKSRPTNITCEYLWNVVRSTEKDQFGSDQCLKKISFYLTIKKYSQINFYSSSDWESHLRLIFKDMPFTSK